MSSTSQSDSSRRLARPRRTRFAALLGLLVLTVLITWTTTGSFSRWLASRLIGELEARIPELLGVSFSIDRLEISLFPLEVRAWGVELGSRTESGPPLLRAGRVDVELDWSVLARERRAHLELRSIRVEKLSLDLRFFEDGSDNLPRRRPGEGPRLISISLGRLELRDSSLRLAEERIDLDLRAQGIEATALDLGGFRLEGSFEADAVELELPRARPANVRVDGRWTLFPDRLEIRKARVLAPHARAEVSGPVRWQPFSRGELKVEVRGDSEFFERLGYLDEEVRGAFEGRGTISWERSAWAVRAEATSPALRLFDFFLEDVRAGLLLEKRRLELAPIRAIYRGGRVEGRFDLELSSSKPAGTVELVLDRVPLDAALEQFHVPVAGLGAEVTGPLRLEIDLSRPQQLGGRGRFAIEPVEELPGRISATGSLSVELVRGSVLLDLPGLWLPASRLDGSGSYSLLEGTGGFELSLSTQDLGEVVQLLPEMEAEALWLPTGGSGELRLGVDLKRDGSYRLALEAAELRKLRARGFAAEHATGELELSAAGVERLEAELREGSRRLRVSGRVPLGSGGDPMELHLLSEGWPLGQVNPWLDLPVTLGGPFFGSVELAGQGAEPVGRVLGQVEDLALDHRSVGPVDFELEFDESRFRLLRAALLAWGTNLELQGHLDRSSGKLDLVGSGKEVPLAVLEGWIPGIERLSGRSEIRVAGGGTLERPELRVRADLADVGFREGPGESPRTTGTAVVELVGEELEMALDLGPMLALGCSGRLSNRGPDLDCSARVPSLAAWASVLPDPLRNGLAGHLGLRASIGAGEAADWRVRGEIGALRLSWQGAELELIEPGPFVLESSGLRLDGVHLAQPGTEEELFVQGVVPVAPEVPIDLRWQLRLAAGRLGRWLGELDARGEISGIGRISGSWERPKIRGQIAWEGGRLQLPETALQPIEDVVAWASLEGSAFVLEEARGKFAGGALRARGRLDWGEAPEVQYRLDLALRDSSPRLVPGWSLRGGGDLVLISTAEGRQIRGQVVVDSAQYTQEVRLSPGELLARLLARSRIEAGEADPLLASTEVAVQIVGRDALRVRNRLARLDGGGDLDLRGTLARPILFGEVAFAPGGTVNFAGNAYEVVRGRLLFSNSVEIDPRLDIVVRTRREDYEVTVEVGGTLSRLETSLRSNPPLPDLEVLALLSGGDPTLWTAPATSGSDPLGTAGQLATSIVYGQAASLVTERVSRLFRLDTLRIDPLTAGDSLSSARVVVGKRISRDLWVTYTEDPSSTAQRILEVEWRLSDRWKIFLTQNGNNSYAIDARWETKF